MIITTGLGDGFLALAVSPWPLRDNGSDAWWHRSRSRSPADLPIYDLGCAVRVGAGAGVDDGVEEVLGALDDEPVLGAR